MKLPTSCSLALLFFFVAVPATASSAPSVLVVVGSEEDDSSAALAVEQVQRWPLVKGKVHVASTDAPFPLPEGALPDRILDLREAGDSKDSLGTRIRHHRVRVHEALRQLGMVEVAPETLVVEGEKEGRLAVAIYVGPGVGGGGPAALAKTLNEDPSRFLARYLGPEDVRRGALAQFDLVVFPGGSGSRQAEGLGEGGREIVRDFVSAGGGYVGICAGCYLACENFSWSLKILNAKTKSSKWRRGVKELELGLAAEASRLLGFDASTAPLAVKYANGPVMEPAGSPELPPYTVLAVFNTEVAENESPPGIQVGSPAILTSGYGRGRVVGISPHPEQTAGLEQVVPRLVEWAAGGAD